MGSSTVRIKVSKIKKETSKDKAEDKTDETKKETQAKNINTQEILKEIFCDFCLSQSRIVKGEFPCYQNASMGIGCKECMLSLHASRDYIIGLPRGFSRMGILEEKGLPVVFTGWDEFTQQWPGGAYNKANVPVWKHLSTKRWTLVRGLSPRINRPFLHVFLEDCMDKVKGAITITQEDLTKLD